MERLCKQPKWMSRWIHKLRLLAFEFEKASRQSNHMHFDFQNVSKARHDMTDRWAPRKRPVFIRRTGMGIGVETIRFLIKSKVLSDANRNVCPRAHHRQSRLWQFAADLVISAAAELVDHKAGDDPLHRTQIVEPEPGITDREVRSMISCKRVIMTLEGTHSSLSVATLAMSRILTLLSLGST